MRVLDLFCGLGGASWGYVDAGMSITGGVDMYAQPDYPYPFHQDDALAFVKTHAAFIRKTVDLMHASPPCAAYTSIGKQNAKMGWGDEHPRLYEPTKDLLEWLGLPYVIENPAARADWTLCGEMFGLGVLRHRKFELGGWSAEQPPHKPHRGRVRSWRHGEKFDGPYVAVYGMGAKHDGRPANKGPGGGKASLVESQVAMKIHWSEDHHGITQAIPPAYTEAIGRAFMATRIDP